MSLHASSRALGALCLVLALLGAPTVARAQGAEDTVHLANGGLVRGQVIEYVPGTHVIIRSAAGTLHTFEEDEVARVEIAARAPADPPPAAALVNLPTSSERTPPASDSAAPDTLSPTTPSGEAANVGAPPSTPPLVGGWTQPIDLGDHAGSSVPWRSR